MEKKYGSSEKILDEWGGQEIKTWGKEKMVMSNKIRAVYTEDTVRVYQAYNKNIANEAVRKYVNEWIVDITDITSYVTELRGFISQKKDIAELLPKERVYEIVSKC